MKWSWGPVIQSMKRKVTRIWKAELEWWSIPFGSATMYTYQFKRLKSTSSEDYTHCHSLRVEQNLKTLWILDVSSERNCVSKLGTPGIPM